MFNNHVSNLIDTIMELQRVTDRVPVKMVHGAEVVEALTREAAETTSKPRDPRLPSPCSFFGIPLQIDHSLPDGVAEFRNDAGEVVARIEGLK